jgi:hypothetical protein
MFNGKLRDKLLFEDEEFTYSRRYFWAYQTLGVMKNGIKVSTPIIRALFLSSETPRVVTLGLSCD